MPIPPGEILAEELEARGMTQRELAARLGRPAQVVNEIVNAKKAITVPYFLQLVVSSKPFAQGSSNSLSVDRGIVRFPCHSSLG